jgi:hypothetical protein
MSRKFDTAIIPHQVVMRMHPEDVANCYHLRVGAADVPVAKDGEPPAPNGLYLRRPDRSRKAAIWYYNEVVGDTGKPISTGCREPDLNGAVAWALTRLARRADAARSRLAPEAMPLCGLLAEYARMVKAKARRGQIRPRTARLYFQELRVLGRCLRNASVFDVQAGGAGKIFGWCEANGYAPNTAVNCASLCKRAVNAVMAERGSAYRLGFTIGRRPTNAKRPLTPDEIARIEDRVWNGTIYGADLKPAMTPDPATGAMQPVRCSRRRLHAAFPFRVAVPFMLDSGTRSAAACEVSLTDPSGPFLDLDAGVLHRRGLMTEDVPGKRRGSCLMSPAFMAFIRPIADAALAAGATHLITSADGRPVTELRQRAWKRILRDAQVPYRVVHCLKDSAIQIARVEGVPLYSAAERFATTPETLVAHYGADWDIAVQLDPAEAQGERSKWLRMHEAVKARAAIAQAGRAARAERAMPGRRKTKALPPPGVPRLMLAPPPRAGAVGDSPDEETGDPEDPRR